MGPAVVGFVNTAGVSAYAAAQDLLDKLLNAPELLLADPNVQKLLGFIIRIIR